MMIKDNLRKIQILLEIIEDQRIFMKKSRFINSEFFPHLELNVSLNEDLINK